MDGVPDRFPVGLRVLVVDDDNTCLLMLERMLRNCLYAVTKCNQAEDALQMLRNRKDGFDIVISDVHMPDMDGFKLLEHIGLETDLPVIMMSADDTQNVVMKGVTQGACDYLIKPIRMEALRNIWQHVVRKKKYEWKEKDSEQSEDGELLRKSSEGIDHLSSPNEGHCKFSKRRKNGEDEIQERGDTSTLKKPRVVWSSELHRQFEIAVEQLGVENAVPKKILEIMHVPGLTRENVASHLQKYRLFLKRGTSRNAPGNSFMSNFNGLNLQALGVSNQIPRHCVTPVQTSSLGRFATRPAISVTPVDQTRISSFENPSMRFMEGPQPPNDNVRQMNLLHGVPTNMDSRQLATLHQAAQVPHGNMNQPIRLPANQNNMLQTQMVRPQPRSQISIETNGTHIMNPIRLPANQNNMLQTQMVRPQPSSQTSIETNGTHIMTLTSVSQPCPQTRTDFCRPVYSSVSQPLKGVDFSSGQRTEFPGDSFSLGSSSVVSTLSPKGILHGEVNSEVKGHGMDNQQCEKKLLITKSEKMTMPSCNNQLYEGMDDEIRFDDFDLLAAFDV